MIQARTAVRVVLTRSFSPLSLFQVRVRVGGISAVVNSVNSAGTSIEFTMPAGTGTDKVMQVQIGATGAGTGNTCVGAPSDTGGDYLLSVGYTYASIGTNSTAVPRT